MAAQILASDTVAVLTVEGGQQKLQHDLPLVGANPNK